MLLPVQSFFDNPGTLLCFIAVYRLMYGNRFTKHKKSLLYVARSCRSIVEKVSDDNLAINLKYSY